MTNKELDVVIKRAREIKRQDAMAAVLRDLMKMKLTRRNEDEEDCEEAYRLEVGRALVAEDGTIERSTSGETTIYVSADELEALIEGIRFKAECLRQSLKDWIHATETEEDPDDESDDEPIRYSITEDRP